MVKVFIHGKALQIQQLGVTFIAGTEKREGGHDCIVIAGKIQNELVTGFEHFQIGARARRFATPEGVEPFDIRQTGSRVFSHQVGWGNLAKKSARKASASGLVSGLTGGRAAPKQAWCTSCGWRGPWNRVNVRPPPTSKTKTPPTIRGFVSFFAAAELSSFPLVL